MKKQNGIRAVLWTVLMLAAALTGCCADGENVCTLDPADPARFTCGGVEYITLREAVPRDAVGRKLGDIQTLAAVDGEGRVVDTCGVTLSFSALARLEERLPEGGRTVQVLNVWALPCALPGFVDSKNEEKTERNAGYLVVSHSGGGMLRQGTRKGIRRTPANRGMRAHWVVKGLDISEDVCHGMCP